MGKQHKEREDPNLVQLKKGIDLVYENEVFSHFAAYYFEMAGKGEIGKKTPACSKADGTILVNNGLGIQM